MQRWALFALLSVVFAVAVQADTCDRFDIRHHGQTLFAITSGDGLVSIPGDLELGSIAANQILMGDYVFGVHNVFGETQLGLRKRRVDADTGKYHVPRAIRGFAHNGTHVIYDHEFRDASEFSLAELRDFMREVLADELALEGHNDPFNLAARYTAAGEWCKEESFDCVPTREDMFVMVSSEESRIAMLDLQALWERDPEAGEEGYAGEVQRLTLIRTNDDFQTLSNENGKIPGRTGFRLADSEVDDVFYLKAGHVSDFEVTPGVKLAIQGWSGGQVIDFTFGSDGTLTGGKIVVGPHPESDPSDVVVMQKSGFVGLETRTPGPALRFTPGRNTRVYVHNTLVAGAVSTPLSVHFGFITRHDQDGAYQFSQQAFTAATSPYVYEFVVPAEGSHVYYDSYGWNSYLNGAGIIAEASWDHDREYVLVAQADDMLNGNTFPGTAKRLSGWYRDTIRIKESKVDPDTKDTIVTIVDEARLPYEGSNDDALNPVVLNDCPAYGGPLRYGTGCWIGGIHQNRGHNIPSATFSPGTAVMIEGHGDEDRSSINGVHYVARESLTSFRIRKIGEEGSSGGEGGFVHIWRLHKSSPYHPQLQNNGASGAYLRFNNEENVLVRVFNADSDSAHIHLHGHKFEVVAENGFALGATRSETSYSVPAGNSADLMVLADNPNRINAWLLANDIQAESDIALPSPWQDANIMGTGHATYVDYTGKAQADLVLNTEGDAVPISWLPPLCTVETATLNVVRDSIGWTVGSGDNIWVFLGGAGSFATNPWTNQPFGDSVTYQWAVETWPAGVAAPPTFFTPNEASTYVVDLANGQYVFTFTVSGHNTYQTNPSVRVVCQKKVTVNVCADEAACEIGQNDLTTLPDTFVSPAITTVRLGVDVTPVAAKRNHLKSTPAATGHATFKLNTARHLSVGNSFTVKEFYAVNPINPTGPWDPQDPNPLSPLHTGRDFTFYRWANQGANTDFWLNINPAVTSTRTGWTFAIKQVVFDSRVQTFGYVLAADIGLGLAAGAQPPARSRVYYPMYQGSSTARGAAHDVYFLILEASDEEFCAQYNCVYAPTLSLIPINSEVLNPASLRPGAANQYIRQRKDTGTFADQRATDFVFNYDPTYVPVLSNAPSDPQTTGGVFAYSPLKYISWTTASGAVKHVVANMPFVYWGNTDVQASTADATTLATALRSERRMLLVETAGCDSFIKGSQYRPENFAPAVNAAGTQFSTPGPLGCTGADVIGTRQRGGQLLEVPDFKRMYAVFKTHRAAFDGTVVPYFTITDTSDLNEAQYHGVPFTPALSKLSSVGTVPFVSSYRQWGNGVAGAGVLGYQEAVVASTPLATSWTPFWKVTNLYWNCGTYNLATASSSPTDIQNTCYENAGTIVVDCGANLIVGFDFFSYGTPTGSCGGGDYAINTACHKAYDNAALGCVGKKSCTITGAQLGGPPCGGSRILLSLNCGLTQKYTLYDILPNAAEIYLKSANIVYTPTLSPTDFTTDYYQLVSNLKSTTCAGYVKSQTGGTWARATEIPNLLAKGVLFETENPGGSALASSMSTSSILNAHVPYVFRPAAPRETEDLVVAPTSVVGVALDTYPMFPGTWVLQWKRNPADLVAGIVNLAARPLIKGAVPYMQKDYGLVGDFPVSEPLVAGTAPGAQNCPNCAWAAIYSGAGTINGAPNWIGQRDAFFADLSKHPFRLSEVTAAQAAPPAVIKYALLECNDAKFAAAFGARYVADLPSAVATSSVWWSEPKPDDSGRYTAAAVAAGLGSFTFSEVPGAVGPTGTPNALYSPLKLFSFQYRWVTCNMPFAVWGTAAEHRLVTDEGDCSNLVRKDMYGSKYNFFPGGPPTCDDEVHPLQRVRGGQAIYWAPDYSTVTLKLHRTVNANDKKWSYYTLWDTTNVIEAGYYGVPVSPRIAAAVTGVETMKIFANGYMCDGCNAYDFQDPIIGTGMSPIRKVTNLLWNCNNVLQSGDLFAASNLDGTACVNDKTNPECDNYPLRVNLKWVECAAYVQRFAASGVVYATDNLTKWVADKVVFETLSPVGLPPSKGVNEMTNSPVVLTVDFN